MRLGRSDSERVNGRYRRAIGIVMCVAVLGAGVVTPAHAAPPAHAHRPQSEDGADFAVLVSALPPPEPLSDEPEDPPAGEEPESLEPESPEPDSFDAASAACLALLAERVP